MIRPHALGVPILLILLMASFTSPANLPRDASFVVRIWWEPRQEGPPLWRGQAIHTATNQGRYFERLEDLVAFVRKWTGIPSKEEDDG